VSPDLGTFGFNAELDRHEANVVLDGAQVAVRVAAEAFDGERRIAELVEVIADRRDRYLDDVADDLLEDKNDDWLSDGEAPLAREDFRRRVRLQAIEVGPAGEVDLLIDDDGMFWGHEVVVRLGADHAIARINLEG
jgi:hypothetical protein